MFTVLNIIGTFLVEEQFTKIIDFTFILRIRVILFRMQSNNSYIMLSLIILVNGLREGGGAGDDILFIVHSKLANKIML